jgi:hypothetical protein
MSSSQVIGLYLYFKVIILYFVNTVYESPTVVCTVGAFCAAPAIYSVTQGHIADDFNDQQPRRYSTDANLRFFYSMFILRFCPALR